MKLFLSALLFFLTSPVLASSEVVCKFTSPTLLDYFIKVDLPVDTLSEDSEAIHKVTLSDSTCSDSGFFGLTSCIAQNKTTGLLVNFDQEDSNAVAVDADTGQEFEDPLTCSLNP